VREALLVLERQGVVRFERNRGVRILETSAHDLAEIFALRLLLEVPATRRSCRLLGDEDLDALDAELAAMRRLADEGAEGPFMAHDQRFHEIVLGGAGNRRLVFVVGQLRDHVRFSGASSMGGGRDLEPVYAEHVAIRDALRARDTAAAAAAMRRHLRNTAELLLAQLDAPADLGWAAE
jgi:DNA-binding GntR family transcriptional regulator